MSSPLLVGTRKGLFLYERNQGKWAITQTAFLGAQVPMVLRDPRDHSLYAALNHGHFGSKLHRSGDGGKTWTEITVPAFPPKSPGAPEDKCPMRGIPIPWNVELIWSLETGGADQPGALWCGTIPGALFHSKDHGQSWELVRSLWNRPERAKWFGGGYDYPGIHSICVDPRDSRRIILGVSCGGVWVSEDNGETWRNRAQGMRAAYMPPDQGGDPDIQDPHRMVQCVGAPDHFWAQHHCGIFKSTDNLESWQAVEPVAPSGFGFAVAVHPRDPATAWFVPAVKDELRIPVDGKLVVNRTRDGGRSFTACTEGLPQNNAYDLVYRHALEITPDGNHLAFGSTTGSLWFSEDQGDSWETLSEHLPPIFCVRWI
jgi:photosystem II stability/assembly factor-like uncharacterized protein